MYRLVLICIKCLNVFSLVRRLKASIRDGVAWMAMVSVLQVSSLSLDGIVGCSRQVALVSCWAFLSNHCC